MIPNLDTPLPGQFSDYFPIKTIGDGFTSKVKHMKHRNTQQSFAMKRILLNSEKLVLAFRTESATLQLLNGHPNIIKIMQSFEGCEKIRKNGTILRFNAIILELAANGTLFEFVNIKALSEELSRTYFSQLIDAMARMAEKKVQHRNIILENMLVGKDFMLKLADFGSASIEAKSNGNSFAPSVLSGDDIFDSGVALFKMLTRQNPYKFRPDKADPYFKHFVENNPSLFWERFSKENRIPPGFFSPNFMDLINRMLAFDVSQRISLPEIRNHPWVCGDILTMDQLCAEMTLRVPRKEEFRIKVENRIQMAKHQNAGTDIPFKGLIPFRSLSLSEKEENLILEEFPELKLNRKVSIEEEGVVRLNCFYSKLEPKKLIVNLFRCLYELKNSKMVIGIKLCSNANKVCATFKENEDNVVYRMNLIGVDEEITAIEFLKKNVILTTRPKTSAFLRKGDSSFYDNIETIKSMLEAYETIKA